MTIKKKIVKESGEPSAPTANEWLKLAGSVARHARLDSIRIIRSEFEESPRSKDEPIPDDPSTGIAVRQKHSHNEGRVVSLVDFRVQMPGPVEVGSKNKNPTINILIMARFELVYELAHAEISDEAIRSFASINSIYNAWPYLREYVQACTTRMGLPPLALPLISADQAVAWSGLMAANQTSTETEKGQEAQSKMNT